MSQSSRGDEMDEGDDVNDVLKIATKNPKVDAKKMLEVRKLLRVLHAQGVSQQGSNVILPYSRQTRVESEYERAKR